MYKCVQCIIIILLGCVHVVLYMYILKDLWCPITVWLLSITAQSLRVYLEGEIPLLVKHTHARDTIVLKKYWSTPAFPPPS